MYSFARIFPHHSASSTSRRRGRRAARHQQRMLRRSGVESLEERRLLAADTASLLDPAQSSSDIQALTTSPAPATASDLTSISTSTLDFARSMALATTCCIPSGEAPTSSFSVRLRPNMAIESQRLPGPIVRARERSATPWWRTLMKKHPATTISRLTFTCGGSSSTTTWI
jgi:hypothetical protein